MLCSYMKTIIINSFCRVTDFVIKISMRKSASFQNKFFSSFGLGISWLLYAITYLAHLKSRKYKSHMQSLALIEEGRCDLITYMAQNDSASHNTLRIWKKSLIAFQKTVDLAFGVLSEANVRMCIQLKYQRLMVI